MSNDEAQAKYALLVKYVTRMRSYQMKYYKYRAVQDKANMLRYQKMVDDMLADYVRESNDPQIKLL